MIRHTIILYLDPPSAPPFSYTLSNIGGNLSITVSWNDDFSMSYFIDKYCVSQMSAVTSLLKACVLPTTPYVFTGLQVGIQYSFIMYAVNCKFQKGNDTDILLIQPQGKLNAYKLCNGVIYSHCMTVKYKLFVLYNLKYRKLQ